jgi:hypothetical protein
MGVLDLIPPYVYPLAAGVVGFSARYVMENYRRWRPSALERAIAVSNGVAVELPGVDEMLTDADARARFQEDP